MRSLRLQLVAVEPLTNIIGSPSGRTWSEARGGEMIGHCESVQVVYWSLSLSRRRLPAAAD